MSNQVNPEVIFLRVSDSGTKIQRILSTVHQHFLSGDPVIIFVPNQQAASYIDHLLWKSPSDSFLPHAVTSSNTRDRVVITEQKSNLNSAKVALNLTSAPCPALGTFEKVYELWDQTDSFKAQYSNSKMEHYRQLGIL